LHNAVMGRLRLAVEKREVLLVNPPSDMPLSRFTRDAGRIKAGIALGREVGRTLARELLGAGEAPMSPGPSEVKQRSA
jgi:hypothetical protein